MKQDSASHQIPASFLERGLGGPAPDSPDEYLEIRAILLDQRVAEPPLLRPNPVPPGSISLEDLVEAEAVTIHEAPATVGSVSGDTPMLCAKDIRLGRAPSRWGNIDSPGAVLVRPGDVAVVMSTEAAVRVCTQDAVLLGAGIRLVRVNPNAVDPHFLAGVLRAAVDVAGGKPIDLYEIAVPRVLLAEQRRYGAAFHQLTEVEAAWRRQRESVERLVRIGFGELAQGRLYPVSTGE
ncbi:hypothetical protein [Nocardia jejuensis]|uniref:hypothetical protein n=1 Tax=Nocardia jejuensis TaxID=328049 RepID=UPI00082DFEB0|nr:hypothetical protein [Nocardia jejuensis]